MNNIDHIAYTYLAKLARNKRDLTPADFKVILDDVIFALSPEMVAEMFACMDGEQQARFYNHVDQIASTWHGTGFCFQLQAITDADGLTLAGRRVMQAIGDYSHWGLVPKGGRSFLDD